MNIKIIETGKILTLSIIDPKSNTDWISDLLGNHDAIDYDDDGMATMSREDYGWWLELTTKYQAADFEVYEYRQTLGDTTAFDDLMNTVCNGDIEDMPGIMLGALSDYKAIRSNALDDILTAIHSANATGPIGDDESNEVLLNIFNTVGLKYPELPIILDDEEALTDLFGYDGYCAIRDAEQG